MLQLLVVVVVVVVVVVSFICLVKQRMYMYILQIAEGLQLQAVRNHQWQIQACSAKQGQGLKEGMYV
jgi:hypothetical protein